MSYQGWHGRLRESTRACFYRTFKDEICFSHYLDDVRIKSHRIALTRLLTSSHRLGIETGRWQRPLVPREDRKYPTCSKLDDEYHFLLECTALKQLRSRLIPKYYWKYPSMFKCMQLLKCNDKQLQNLAKYVYLGVIAKQ